MQDKHSWHKQMAGIMARASTDLQLDTAMTMYLDGESDQHIILTLERKYFLSRRPAEAILDYTKAEDDLAKSLQELQHG